MKFRKFTALTLCLVMLLGLLSGCEKPMDAQTLVAKMEEAIGGRTATSMLMTMDMDMTLQAQGTSMEMAMDTVVGIKQSDTMNYTDMDMTVEVLGITEEMNAESYTALEDGKYVTYTYSETEDAWSLTETEETEVTEVSYSFYQSLADMDPAALVLEEETVLLDEREVYVLRATLSGDQLRQSLAAGMEALDEIGGEAADQIDFSAMQCPAVYYIDKETFLPAKVEMQMEGLGEVMNALMGSMMETLTGMSMAELELTVDVPLCTIVCEGFRFDAVEVPAVPAEGVEAALAALPPADGIYTLTCEDNTVQIRLPEDYTVLEFNEYYLVFVNADYTVYGQYSLLYEGEAEVLAYLDEQEAYATENGYFVSRSEIGEYGPFKTAQINYVENMVDYYAWKEIECGVLDVMVSVMDGTVTVDLDELLDCVEVSVG